MANYRTLLGNLKRKSAFLAVLFFLAACISLLYYYVHFQDEDLAGPAGETVSVPLSALQDFFPEAFSLKMRDSLNGTVLDREGRPIGKALYSGNLPARAYGYGGPVPLFVLLDNQDRIEGIYVGENHETPSYMRRVERSGLLEAWNGMPVGEAAGLQPDAVSGASYTSRAISANVRQVLHAYGQGEEKSGRFPGLEYVFRMLLSCTVVVFSLYFFFRPGRFARCRLYLYAASVLVLGFWNGEMLSVDRFYAWLTRGVPATAWFVFAVFVLAVVLPLLTNRAFYCSYLCPYGSAQELMGRLRKKKYVLPASWAGLLKYLPQVLLSGCACAALAGLVDNFSGLEVFAGFHIRSASVWVLVLFGFFLLLSPFVNRPWCRYVCPTGYLLSLFQKTDWVEIGNRSCGRTGGCGQSGPDSSATPESEKGNPCSAVAVPEAVSEEGEPGRRKEGDPPVASKMEVSGR